LKDSRKPPDLELLEAAVGAALLLSALAIGLAKAAAITIKPINVLLFRVIFNPSKNPTQEF
jgi:hypothetical protein